MHKGSCLCGQVAYEIDGAIGPIVMCHCSRCRKAGGSAFATNGVTPSAGFRITRGAELLRTFSAGTGADRVFCSNCGSAIYSRRDAQPDLVRVRMGTLDTPLEQGPGMHIFVGSKAGWHEIHDELPQHQARPPA